MLDRICRLPKASPGVGRAVYPRGFLYLSAGIAVIGRHVRLPPQKKKKKKKKRHLGVLSVWLRLELLTVIRGGCPTRLKARDATALITGLCWLDGWPHGADSVWQACVDVLQRAEVS